MLNNPVRTLQFALVADGVPLDKVFPIDVDRAFKKLEQIKPHIKVWWTQGNQSQQLMRDGEVDMMVMWNARASELPRAERHRRGLSRSSRANNSFTATGRSSVRSRARHTLAMPPSPISEIRL